MRNTTESELCLVVAVSSKKGWVKFIPLGDGTEAFWGDLGAVSYTHLTLPTILLV